MELRGLVGAQLLPVSRVAVAGKIIVGLGHRSARAGAAPQLPEAAYKKLGRLQQIRRKGTGNGYIRHRID